MLPATQQPFYSEIHGTIRILMKFNCSALLATISSIVICGNAHAIVYDFTALLSGPAENPPNASPGTGFSSVIYDSVAHTLSVNISFSGLTGNTTASHIHAPTAVAGTGPAGVATTTPTFPNFPLGVTSGTYSQVLDLSSTSSYNAPFLTANGGTAAGAEAALVDAMLNGKAYVNIHSSTFQGGEIRGFLQVPDGGSTLALLGLGLAGLGTARRFLLTR